MKPRAQHELPPEKEQMVKKAARLEWISIAYLLSAIALLALVLGSSQAMKAAWVEDILSLLPPISFLIAARVRERAPNRRFPWGYHRAVSIGYLSASLALLTLGSYILIDSLIKLVTAEHPPIGLIEIFGQEIWLGWLMIGALVYTGVPAVFLGRAKLPLASELHDKVLYADAEMNKADWMTAGAAILGVVGIGFGLWWADAVAGALISVDIAHDGWKNTRASVRDLMDERPTSYDGSEDHPLNDRLERHLRDVDWIEDVRVRLREEGHVMTGHALVVPRAEENIAERVETLMEDIEKLDWQLHDVLVTPVTSFEDPERPPEQEVG